METHWRSEIGAKVTGAKLEEALAKCKKSYYSVRFLQDAIDESVVDDERKLDVKQWISSFEDYQNDIEEKEKELNKFLSDIAETSLKETDISPIKDYLDLWIQVSRFCKSFYAEGVEKEILDEAFYQILQELLSVFDEIIYFYNKLRNYVTQKPYSLDKMRIKFGNPTLANGWHKEKDDGSTILRKDGKYYLAVTNPINKKMVIPASTKHCTEEEYEKMVYKQFPDVKKMIPKCTMVNEVKSFFADKNAGDTYVLKKAEYQGDFVITREEYDLSCAEEEGYKKWQKDYLRITQDEEGYQDAVKKWNCFCMRFLKTYKSTADYDYSSLMKPEEYESVDLFYHDLDKILYKIRFEYVSSKEIDELVKEGRIFLFQIYNKDFSEYRRPESKKNLHTLYWEALFSEENQKANVIKLNGGAELFKRKASIKNKVIHKAGEVLVNKRTIDGEPIPDDIYMDLCAYYNGKEKVSSDSDDTYKQYIDKVYTSTKKYDIVKDKRFMKDQYEFHVPITINYQADGVKYFNQKVLEVLRKNPDVNIIGLDRGERNLISYVVLNQKGEIVNHQQGSFNVIQKMDYQKKLQQKEQNRDKERKTWKNIETIKELKEGYISQVVHELADMAIKNNAIIVMEDLNFGFKRGRTKVERQVYQKFEMALINKLQYLVMDKTEGEAMLNPGGVLQGYQLAVQPKSLKDVGKQCGFVFYVPPGYTSKIDPTTGFADVFNMSNITNRSSRKAFFEKFDNIFYDKSRNMFGFSFNYENFITYQTFYKKDWTVYSNGSRYMWNRNTKTESCVDVTEKLKALFSENQINYEQDNLYQQIMDVECDVKHAEFWSELFWYFRVMLRLRNSSNEHEIDQIISPVLNKLGEFFQTPEEVTEDSCMSDLPMDADTNGAYHIALKGLLLLQERFNDDTVDLEKSLPKDFYKITNAQWFEYMQKEK
ncbi:MAG: type V CRISPR-associated protein Cas12a/Cpf1 [Butyribacter sp.]|nr:type V CRISPR-associated protein Cas12a/Cpf1 [bacterium]MDY3854967.1 type V CRISPR-associated protein Cas12a/Cpf1 [Butyribacter sp.]